MADHLTLLERRTNAAADAVADTDSSEQTAQLTVEQRFAVVPEWMLDSTVSGTAFRLYADLARYGNTSGVRMPGRALLARRLHRSVDTVDRAVKKLTAAGILSVEHRTQAGRTDQPLPPTHSRPRRRLRAGPHRCGPPPRERPGGSTRCCHGRPHPCGPPGRSPAAQPKCSYRDNTFTHRTRRG